MLGETKEKEYGAILGLPSYTDIKLRKPEN
jgi:hypothetical protein